jgi:hypothetical protein
MSTFSLEHKLEDRLVRIFEKNMGWIYTKLMAISWAKMIKCSYPLEAGYLIFRPTQIFFCWLLRHFLAVSFKPVLLVSGYDNRLTIITVDVMA